MGADADVTTRAASSLVSHGELLDVNRRFLWNPFTQMKEYLAASPVIVARGEGVKLVDVDGVEYYDGNGARRHLLEQAARFRTGLAALGHDTHGSCTQIVPLVAGTNDAALRLSAALETAGVLAVPIRPPTVPPGAARLRFSLSALHTADDVDHVLAAIARYA